MIPRLPKITLFDDAGREIKPSRFPIKKKKLPPEPTPEPAQPTDKGRIINLTFSDGVGTSDVLGG